MGGLQGLGRSDGRSLRRTARSRLDAGWTPAGRRRRPVRVERPPAPWRQPPVRRRHDPEVPHDRAAAPRRRSAARRPWRFVGGWLLAAVLAFTLAGTVGGTLIDDYTMPGSDSQARPTCCASASPTTPGPTARVVVHSDERRLDRAVLDAVRPRAARAEHVAAVDPRRSAPTAAPPVVASATTRRSPTSTSPRAVEHLRRPRLPPATPGCRSRSAARCPTRSTSRALAELIGFGAAGGRSCWSPSARRSPPACRWPSPRWASASACRW